MKCQWFEPEVPIADEAVIMSTDFVSGLEDYLGDKAQKVARVLGRRVLAYERFSADDLRFSTIPSARRSLSSARYVRTAGTIGRALSNELHQEGIRQVVVSGNSAAGLEAIALTLTETLPVSHLAVMDPSGLQPVAPGVGQTRYFRYQLWDERRRPASLDEPDESNIRGPAALLKLRRALFSIAVYSPAWRSSLALDGLKQIAGEMPSVTALTVFPEHTFNGPPDFLQRTVDELKLIRSQDDAPFEACLVDGYHSRFERSARYADAVNQTLALT